MKSVSYTIKTVSDIEFDLISPTPTMIDINDIAHALSHIARANGHFLAFLSVARHCINCAIEAKAQQLPTHIQLACLLHDASEAYLGDMTRPLKNYLVSYQQVEDPLIELIYNKYGLSLTDNEHQIIKNIDQLMLRHEFAYFKSLSVSQDDRLVSQPGFTFTHFNDDKEKYLSLFYKLESEI